MISTRSLSRGITIIYAALIPGIYIVMRWNWRISFLEIQTSPGVLSFFLFFIGSALLSFFLGYWFIRSIQSQNQWETFGWPHSMRSMTKKLLYQKLRELAREYEVARASLSSSPERTAILERVVAKMRSFFISNSYPIEDLMISDSAGMRLAAVIALQINPKINKENLHWLADRIYVEKPFIGLQASLAFLCAARVVDLLKQSDVRDAIKEARYNLSHRDLQESDHSQILKMAEAALNEDT